MAEERVPTLRDIENVVSALLLAEQFSGDQNGMYIPSACPVARLGVALEPWPGIAAWVRDEKLDALWLHRPWKLEPLPAGIGVLAYHYAFDERLTTGYNPFLADALGLSGSEVLGDKEGRPLGLIGNVAPLAAAAFEARVETEFGGLAGRYGASAATVSRACVVGALRPELIREAAARGAQVYITGEYRARAQEAVAATRLRVLEVGHRRSEVWGLRTLAALLSERFPALNVRLSAG